MRSGRVGASFDIFNPAELSRVTIFGQLLNLHQYRVADRFIADDATILIKAEYVGVTGRLIAPTQCNIASWLGLATTAVCYDVPHGNRLGAPLAYTTARTEASGSRMEAGTMRWVGWLKLL